MIEFINRKGLVYNNDISNCKNLLLIDGYHVFKSDIFLESSNVDTFSVLYLLNASKNDLLSLLHSKFTTIDRIAIVFKSIGNDPVTFIEGDDLFEKNDTFTSPYSNNIEFILSLIRTFNVANIDFLSCNTLLYSKWNNFYNILTNETSVIVGASDDETGNIKYGGDWIMENTSINIENIYFNESIQYYNYLLDESSSTIIIKNNGDIVGTGTNDLGQLGISNYTNKTTFQTMDLTSITDSSVNLIVCENQHTIVLTDNNIIWGVGSNFSGELGLGNNTLKYNTLQIMDLSGIGSAYPIYVSTGLEYTIILLNDGTVWGTGRNNNGQLGLNDASNNNYNTLQEMYFVSNDRKGIFIECGLSHTIVVMDDGTIWGTGKDDKGQLGLNDASGNTYIYLQEMFLGGTNNGIIKEVSCGAYHTMVLMTDGSIYGCGDNFYGQLGLGYNTIAYPVDNHYIQFNGNNGYYISGSNTNLLADVTLPFTIEFWAYLPSYNTTDPKGNAYANNHFFAYGGLRNYSYSVYSLAVYQGKLQFFTGSGTTTNYGNSPYSKLTMATNDIIPINQWIHIAVVYNPSDTIKGRLFLNGVNIAESSTTPTQVSTIHNLTLGYADYSGSYNADSFLNNNSLISNFRITRTAEYSSNFIPNNVPSKLENITDTLFLGFQSSTNIDNSDFNHTISSHNSGQSMSAFASTPYITSLTSTIIPSGKTPMKISCGKDYTIVLMDDGTCYSTGRNNVGQLGIGNTTDQNTLQLMDLSSLSGKTITDVASGLDHTIALIDDNTLWGTGSDSVGQLGINISGTYATSLQEMISTQDVVKLLNYSIPFTYGSTSSSAPCFKTGTTVLCKVNGEDKYVNVKNINTNMEVKTYKHGYKRVQYIGFRDLLYDDTNVNTIQGLYKCSKEKYPELTEDLIITGCHSLLIDNINKELYEKIIKTQDRLYLTDDKIRLISFLDERSIAWNRFGNYTIWHFSLEHENSYMNYGVYVNGGLLVESCSRNIIINYSNMKFK